MKADRKVKILGIPPKQLKRQSYVFHLVTPQSLQSFQVWL